MSALTFARYALPVVLAGFYLFCVALPARRLRRRTGATAMVIHEAANPFQRLIGAAMGLFVAALALWVVLFALLGPAPLEVWHAPAALAWSGWTALCAGFVIVVTAQAQMGASWRVGIDRRPTTLVRAGLFSVVRNPIFSGMLLMVLGVALLTPSAWTVMGGLVGLLLMALQSRLEEQHLLALHGESYRAYASEVGRFVPGVGRLPRDRQPWESSSAAAG